MTTLSTCLSALGLFNSDKLNGDDLIDTNDFNVSSKYDDILVDPLRSDSSDDPLNMLQDIDHIFSSTSNYSNSLDGINDGQNSIRTSISSDVCPQFPSSDYNDIDLDMIQEVLDKDCPAATTETFFDTSASPTSDIELDTNEVTVSEDIEEEDLPYFDTRELHNYSRTVTTSCGQSSPGSSTKEDIEPEDEDNDHDMEDNEDFESDESSKSSNEEESDDNDNSVDTIKGNVLTSKSSNQRQRKMKKNGRQQLSKYQSSNGQQQKLTRRSITDRNLTEEEKRLLAKEGYNNFPKLGTPLTKMEEKVLRKVRRKIRNKKSAQCSRQRKKEYVEELEKKYQDCNFENSNLKKELFKLRKENSNLLTKMKNLISGKANVTTGTALVPSGHSNGINGGNNGTTNTNSRSSFKTSFFVLFLSFFLVLLPFFNPDSIEDKSLLINTESLESLYKEPVGVGRHLMAYNSSPSSSASSVAGEKYSFSLFYPKINHNEDQRAINSSIGGSKVVPTVTTASVVRTSTTIPGNVSSGAKVVDTNSNLLNYTKEERRTTGIFIE